MQKKRTITLDERVYDGLHSVVGDLNGVEQAIRIQLGLLCWRGATAGRFKPRD